MDYLNPTYRAQRIADLTETLNVIHKSTMQSSGDALRILLHASRYIYSQRDFYLSNALCAHCEKPIENRNNEDWLHEDGFSGCDLDDGDFEATPATVKDSIRRAA